MKIVMLGAGALGSTIGGTLAIGGNDVHFVDMWQEHVDLINKDGLHMTKKTGMSGWTQEQLPIRSVRRIWSLSL